MRRDYDAVRNILLAIGDDNVSDNDELEKKLNLNSDKIGYHLDMLVNQTNLLRGERKKTRMIAGGEGDDGPLWTHLTLTWEGNDFLDAIGDERAWKKVKKSLASGSKMATIEALKQVAKGAAAAGLATIFAEADSTPTGRVNEEDNKVRGESVRNK